MASVAAFIRPTAGTTTYDGWSRPIAFGQAGLPATLNADPARCSGLVHLDVDGGDPTLHAAFGGTLSTRPPTSFLHPPPEPDGPAVAETDTLTLYMSPVLAKVQPAWQQMCMGMTARFGPPTVPGLAEAADTISCFVYRNVDAALARQHLLPRLRPANGRPPGDPAWAAFLTGDGASKVAAGDPIGAAGAPYLPGGHRQVAVGLRTRFGMDDPGSWYADPATPLDPTAAATTAALVALLGRRLPLIDPTRDPAAVGSDRLWPWAALTQYRRARDLPRPQWRALGDAQKALYRARLGRRCRPTAGNAGVPRFEYDGDDLANLFQLEAVAEFYLNFPDPWNGVTVPGDPADPTYTRLDFLPLYGTTATAAGTTLTLDGAPDLARVSLGRDTVELAGETARPGRQFRVMAADRAGDTLTLDRPPTLTGSTAWSVHHNPILVIIDAFGFRVRGAAAVPDGVRRVRLDGLTDLQLTALSRVNRFETVTFDRGAGPRQDARIETISVNRAARTTTLELDSDVAPPAAGSGWAIPSGVGGVQGNVADPYLQAHPTWGWNHYDGMAFLVGDGEVVVSLPWSTYTSRVSTDGGKEVGTKYHSSVKGNKHYRISSVFSGKKFINVSWRVVEPDGQLTGDLARRRTTGVAVAVETDLPLTGTLVGKYQTVHLLSAVPPRTTAVGIRAVNTTTNRLTVATLHRDLVPAAAPYWIFVHDGVRDARYYFKDVLEADTAPSGTAPPAKPGALGKGGIRIHLGTTKRDIASQGCLVSPHYPVLRSAMSWLHARANVTFTAEHPGAERIAEMVSLQQPPPPVAAYYALQKQLTELTETVQRRLADPLVAALDRASRGGLADDDLRTGLRSAIADLQNRIDGAGDAGDEPTVTELSPVLHDLLDLASTEDLHTALEVTAPVAAEFSQLRRQLAELTARTGAELASWGWAEAIHGDLYVIRPDERAE